MTRNTAYVKGLIKQWIKGNLTEKGRAELDLTKQRYSEEEWFRVEVDAFCEAEDERTKSRKRWPPFLGKAAAAAAMITVLLLMGWWGREVYVKWPRPMDLGSNCPAWASDAEIPGSEFACTIWWGDSTSITVDRTSRGRLGVIRNLEVWRNADGSLALRPLRPAAADTSGIPSIRIATHPYQQCIVRLPGAGEVRLNASSVLEYPLSNLGRDTTLLGLRGQALVRLNETEKGAEALKLVLQTPHAQLQASVGSYTVRAEADETQAILLDGKAVLFSHWGNKQQNLSYPGDAITMQTTRSGTDGPLTAVVDISCIGKEEALGWTRMKRVYQNTPVRQFVADMSRWYGFKVENMNCVPLGPRITATVCYQAPVAEVYAQLRAANIFMVEKDGMVSFCGPQIDLQEPTPRSMRNGLGLLASRDTGR